MITKTEVPDFSIESVAQSYNKLQKLNDMITKIEVTDFSFSAFYKSS